MTAYQPAAEASPVPPWSIAIRSQRDLTLKVPINYNVQPGVSLAEACFAHGVFEETSATLCLSNLLATGFRKVTWDLYWDDGRRVWSFCPVQLDHTGSNDVNTTTAAAQITSSAAPVTTAVILARSIGAQHGNAELCTVPRSFKQVERQVNELATTGSSTAASSTTLATTSGTTVSIPNTTSTLPPAQSGIATVGPYSCSQSLDLTSLASVLAGFISGTSDTLLAKLVTLTINLHVASSSNAPTLAPSALNSSSIPTGGESISSLLQKNLTSSMYMPSSLRTDRAHLNSSWFNANDDIRPLLMYFNISTNAHGVASTENGWPSEEYLDFSQNKRLIVEFGQIDTQLALYNISADYDTVFPSNYLQDEASSVQFNAAGQLSKGCLYNKNDLTLAGNNNSFAAYSLSQLQTNSISDLSKFPISQVANLSACGISPILNNTLHNITADEDVTPYAEYINSSFWSWAYGEPRNVSSTENDESRIRCAAMDASVNGRWRVVDCTEKHYAACRVGNRPFSWKITSSKAIYTYSEEVCPDGTDFAVPVTPLENRHLFETMQQSTRDQLIWVNFNSLDVESCWVSGVNASCPYNNDKNTNQERTVVVPVVASVIVFVVAALTIFVKCAANRRNSRRKRRRKGEDGWDYEGVPS